MGRLLWKEEKMSEVKRVFLMVLDSCGCGYEPDAEKFGDVGANTLASIRKSPKFHCPNMERLGLFHIDGFKPDAAAGEYTGTPEGVFGKFQELSMGKDTTVGHWELAGLISPKPLPTYPDGFPKEVLDEFEKRTGRKVLCNKPYSGTEVIKDYGEEHMKTGALIIYTSADSVFQIAANEAIVPVEQLYEYCRIAREILQGEHGVGRVIARPFEGSDASNFKRTPRRHDFSLVPPKDTMLDKLQQAGKASIGIGKIKDIFAGKGVDATPLTTPTVSNADGMEKTSALIDVPFNGLAFVNLVETDMTYGHRRDIDGYANAISAFDEWLGGFEKKMHDDDVIMITADHGCDPGFRGTDHTREYIPFLAYGKALKADVDLGTRVGFSDIAKTVLDLLGVDSSGIPGESFKKKIVK